MPRNHHTGGESVPKATPAHTHLATVLCEDCAHNQASQCLSKHGVEPPRSFGVPQSFLVGSKQHQPVCGHCLITKFFNIQLKIIQHSPCIMCIPMHSLLLTMFMTQHDQTLKWDIHLPFFHCGFGP